MALRADHTFLDGVLRHYYPPVLGKPNPFSSTWLFRVSIVDPARFHPDLRGASIMLCPSRPIGVHLRRTGVHPYGELTR